MIKQEEKKRLRAALRAQTRDLSVRYRTEADGAIAVRLLSMPEYRTAGTVFCFVGAGWEIDTRPILADVLASGKTLCVPLCTAPGIMELRQLSSLNELVPGAYGILAPPPDSRQVPADEVDLSVLPCLSCSRTGLRLGQGGGYYDRFLSKYRGGTVLLCREKLLREEIPVEPHDYPIPWVLTERALYEDGTPARLG